MNREEIVETTNTLDKIANSLEKQFCKKDCNGNCSDSCPFYGNNYMTRCKLDTISDIVHALKYKNY